MNPAWEIFVSDSDQQYGSLTQVKALEPYEGRPEKTVAVIEIFGPTIQGEGAMIGVKTMFVRFGGCDFRCGKCDSMHAVDPDAVKANAKWLTQKDIAEFLLEAKAATGVEWVTLSGGNPTIWDLQELTELLEGKMKIAVETQGSIWRDWLRNVQQLTISPKGPGMQERFNQKIFRSFVEKIGFNTKTCVKIVCFGMQDMEFALGVDQILDTVGRDVRGGYLADTVLQLTVDRESRYLSLGNYMQPILGEDMQLHDQDHEDGFIDEGVALPEELLASYKNILEMDFLPDPRLSHWKFLPQLHVLVWANKAKV